MARVLTEEERQFIADCHQKEGKVGKQIIDLFKEKFDWIPSASVINKYQKYKKSEEVEEEELEEGGKAVVIETKDTRKIKDVFDMKDGDIPDEIFEAIVKMRGRNKRDTFRFLQKCYKRGLTKINLKTGEITK